MSDRYPLGDGRGLEPPRADRRGLRGGYAASYVAPAGLGLGGRLSAGAIGGLWAAIIMGIVGAVVDGLLGRGPTTMTRLIGSAVYGPGALRGDAPVIVGIALLLAAGLVAGILFGLVFGGARANLVLWGIVYGVALWVLARYVALPGVDPLLAARVPSTLYLLYFIIFGAVLGGYVADRQRDIALF